MRFHSIPLLLVCIIAANAVPIKSTNQKSFRLRSHVLTPPRPLFESLYIEPYHIYPPFNYAVFTPKTPKKPGIIGRLNGTAEDLANDAGDLVFDFGGQFTYSFVIDQINATYNPIKILPGSGTKSIFIDQGVIKYHNPLSGGFYGESTRSLLGYYLRERLGLTKSSL